MPKVSVIIPCYNYARFLPEAVESVVAQTYRDFEIIIVNDGSTDDSCEVAERLIAKHPDVNIRLINQANQGLPATRNNGIKEARGEYILPLDADDMIEPEYLEQTVKALDEKPGITIAYTHFKTFGVIEGGTVRCEPYSLQSLLESNRLPVCSLFRKSAWAEVGGYKLLPGYADWEFWISLGEAGHKGELIDKALFLYRKHGLSMIDRSTRMHEELCGQIRRLHPELYNAAALENILKIRDMQIQELRGDFEARDREIRQMSEYIKEIHTLRGFIRRAARAALRRLGVRK